MDFATIRRLVITSMFADDWLMERLVLKGGNALNLVHRIGGRASLDVDFSLEGDFDDLAGAKQRLENVLEQRFDSAGYVVFDFDLTLKPSKQPGPLPTWGGYVVAFKIISKQHYAELGGDAIRMQARSEEIAPGHRRIFRVEISKHEYCKPKTEALFDGYTIFVYSPAMIAIEKLRAICQQMPEYHLIPSHIKRPRARDFYDIDAIIKTGVDLGSSENLGLTEAVFTAKEVPFRLIPRIPEHREFHRPDWDAVVQAVSGELKAFDVYFDGVVLATKGLQPLWEE